LKHGVPLPSQESETALPEEEQEAGEIRSAPEATAAAAKLEAQLPALPKLEDILRPRVIR
jgi:hypothetical protein